MDSNASFFFLGLLNVPTGAVAFTSRTLHLLRRNKRVLSAGWREGGERGYLAQIKRNFSTRDTSLGSNTKTQKKGVIYARADRIDRSRVPPPPFHRAFFLMYIKY